jgi:hypothetical protein
MQTSEKHEKLDALQSKIKSLESHKKETSAQPVRLQLLLKGQRGDTSCENLREEFFPVSFEDFLSIYKIKVDKKLIELETEYANLSK